MKNTKSGKAAGASGVPVDLLKYLTRKEKKCYIRFYRKSDMHAEEMPRDWELSEIATIYKN